MLDFHPFLASITRDPLLIDAQSIDVFNASLRYLGQNEEAKALLDTAQGERAESDTEFWSYSGKEHPLRPYVVHNGILQIPVQGVLLHRFSYALGRWATGYRYIEKALVRGLRDPNVKGIALMIDSPGGEVAGCFELCDKIFEARGEKPIRAFASDHAFSAAYALASAATEIVVTRSGGTGSVGVITAHADYSGAMEKYGVKVTLIFAGSHKADGNPYEQLPENVKGRIQERINRTYGVFTSTVARNRGLSEDDVRATEALCYDANESVEKRFANRIGALDEEMVVFTDEVAEMENEQMSFTQEQLDAAVATATATARAEGVKAGKLEGAAEERTRVTAILTSPEGQARPKTALAFAKTSESAESVIAALSDLPEEKASAPAADGEGKPTAKKSAFELAMEQTQNPGVGATAGSEGDGGGDQMSVKDRVFANAGRAPARARN